MNADQLSGSCWNARSSCVHLHAAANLADHSIARHGIRYLLPEIVLVAKARLRRPKDEPDFAATLPILEEPRRAWMRDALQRIVPGHPWIARL